MISNKRVIQKTLLMVALLSSLSACDGYVVRLTVREQPTVHDRPHRHTLYVCGGQNVVELLQGVAKSLSLREENAASEAGAQKKHEWLSADGKFMLNVQGQDAGVWSVDLVDWPDFPQSNLSKQAEAEIRHAVQTSCSPK